MKASVIQPVPIVPKVIAMFVSVWGVPGESMKKIDYECRYWRVRRIRENRFVCTGSQESQSVVKGVWTFLHNSS